MPEDNAELEHEVGFMMSSSQMRRIARGLKNGANALQLINHLPQEVNSEVKGVKDQLEKASKHCTKDGVCLVENKAKVETKRGETDKAIDEMFSKLDLNKGEMQFPSKKELAQCLTNHKLLEGSSAKYLTEKGVIPDVAKAFADQKATPEDVVFVSGFAAQRLGHSATPTALFLTAALTDCARK